MSKQKVIIYGAGGYGGVGLVEILLRHPKVEIVELISREGAGAPYSELYPHLKTALEQVVINAESYVPTEKNAFVFLSTPDGVGQSIAPNFLELGCKVIDFSGDFRFKDAETHLAYSAWQQGEFDHQHPELLKSSCYGLPEFHRKEIEKATLVGNPGCMAMSCLLSILPICRESYIDLDSIVFDVKTGISGAGKKPKAHFHFPAANENLYAYKVGQHQHIFEIENLLSSTSGKKVVVQFTPHVIPMTRGIMSSCYVKLNQAISFEAVETCYRQTYSNEPFVHVDFNGKNVEISHVRGSNRCFINVHYVKRTHSIVVVSAIDNLQKGQSGNAVQCMNLMLGYPEDLGLEHNPQYPS